jgi:sugar O-acyltransferase (sialic acid O-acetyltransferase NeuD family)
MPKKVIVLGGQGDPVTMAKAIEDSNLRGKLEWEIAGFLNDNIEINSSLSGFKILGGLNCIPDYLDQGYHFLNGIYRIDGNPERIKMFEGFQIPDSQLVTFIHPSAVVSPGASIGPGCLIMPNVSISHDVSLGKCCVVLQGATVAHDTQIADYVHISAQACLGAYLKIEKGVHIGMNSTIRENVQIGAYSTLGMGSVLLSSIVENEIWAGNPAKFLRRPITGILGCSG